MKNTFRFLVVEDIDSTRNQMVALLREQFPGSIVDPAANVDEGLRRIQAASGDEPYDAAVLDFKLPKNRGQNPEVDEQLCLSIRKHMPSVLVVHITAYDDDPLVTRHLKNVHLDPKDPRALAFSKLDATWGGQLIKKLKEYLYGAELERELDELFGDSGASPGPYRRSAHVAIDRGITHRLATVSRYAEHHWPSFGEAIRRRVRDIFYVDDSAPVVRVSLLDPESSTEART